MDVVARNGREALREVVKEVMINGDEVAPRGLRTKEMRHLSVIIDNPRDILCTGINANQSLEVVAAEAIQLIGGVSHPEFAVKHAPNLAKFRNQKGTFDGAYGPRVGHLYKEITQRLAGDPDTRQAIVPIWNESDVLRWQSLDYPCTLSLGFFIRNEYLEMDVFMRSNDVNWGFKNDIFQFTQLQLTIANALNLDPGPYRHTAMSMHLYESSFEWAEKLLSPETKDHLFDTIRDHPQGFGRRGVDDMNAARVRAGFIMRLTNPGSPTPSERWYLKALRGE